MYVDDILAAGPEVPTRALFKALESEIEFDVPEEITKYLGVVHHFEKTGDVTKCVFDMVDYCDTASSEFAAERGHKFRKADTPYAPELPRDQTEALEAQPGEYAETCAHHLMKLLYAARQAKAEVIVAITRLASDISRWNADCDRQLCRLFDFVHAHPDWCMTGSLAPVDITSVEVVAWPDGDLAGDKARSSRSTSGRFVELVAGSGRSFPLAWAHHKQGATATSTPDAETASLSDCVRLDALALQSLMNTLLRRPVTLRVYEDNEPCVKNVKKGYSPAMRYLPRTQRTSLGLLNEVFHGPQNETIGNCVLEHHEGKTHKGDHFTKELHNGTVFQESCFRLGITPLGTTVSEGRV